MQEEHPEEHPEEHKDKQINLGRAERWLSGAGGALLIRAGLRRRSLGGVILAAGGAALVYRGATGFCAVYDRLGLDTAERSQSRQIEVKVAMTVARPTGEVFGFWRQLDTLPQAARHLESVTALGDGTTRWVAREGMLRLMWEAQSVEDAENRRISWRSLPGSRMYTEGDVQMSQAPGDRGTEIHVRFCFTPPGGIAGLALTPLLRMMARVQLGQELHRFKQMLETGEVATSAMRPDFKTRRDRQMHDPTLRKESERQRAPERQYDQMRGQETRSQERPTPAGLGAEMPTAPEVPQEDVQARVGAGKEVRQ